MPDNQDDNIIIGRKRIARAFGISEASVWRWSKKHGFPIVDLPNGYVCTTYSLIDMWLMGRYAARRKELGYDDGSEAADG